MVCRSPFPSKSRPIGRQSRPSPSSNCLTTCAIAHPLESLRRAVRQILVSALGKQCHLALDHVAPVAQRGMNQALAEHRLDRESPGDLVAEWHDALDGPGLVPVQALHLVDDVDARAL